MYPFQCALPCLEDRRRNSKTDVYPSSGYRAENFAARLTGPIPGAVNDAPGYLQLPTFRERLSQLV